MYLVWGHLYTHALVCFGLAIADVFSSRAVGLQTDCMVIVLAPVVRLPDSHMYALWP